MKKLVPVDITIDTCMDADDLGHRLTECVATLSTDLNVINLVKIKISSCVKACELYKMMCGITDTLRSMGAENCVFIPIQEGLIDDVSVDHIEVRDV